MGMKTTKYCQLKEHSKTGRIKKSNRMNEKDMQHVNEWSKMNAKLESSISRVFWEQMSNEERRARQVCFLKKNIQN